MAGHTYTIDVQATASGPDEAAEAVQSLADSMSGVDAAETAFADAMRAADAATTDAAAAFTNAAEALDHIEDEAKAAAKATTKVGDAGGKAKVNWGELEGAVGKLGGPLGRMGQLGFGAADAFQKLGNTLSLAAVAAAGVAIGIGILVVAVVAAIAAVAKLTYELAQYTLTASDAASKTSIMLEDMTGSAKAAGELSGVIRRVAQTTPQSVAEVTKLAEGLYTAGKRGAELEDALTRAALEASGLSKDAAPELVARRMAKLDVITKKFGDHIADIFSGPKTVDAVHKFETALGEFVDLFGQNHAEGRALQTLLRTVMEPLFGSLASGKPLAVQFFRGMILAALKTAIAIVTVTKALDKMIPDEVVGGMSALEVAFWAGVVAAAVLAVSLGLVALAMLLIIGIIAAVIVSAALFVAMFFAIPAAIVAVALALSVLLIVAIATASAYLTGLAITAASAAKDLISGLVNGITSGAGAVANAVKAMASKAIATLKSTLGIASPSKVFEVAGGFTAEGFVEGVTSETPKVRSAVETMAAPPDVRQGRTPGGTGASSSSRTNVTVTGPFNFYGIEGAEGAVSSFEEIITKILEGDVSQLEPEPA